MLHADAGRAIASHGVANQATAQAIRDGPVMRVDVSDQIVRDELLEIPCGDRTRIHGTIVQRLRVRQHHDHLFGALGESAFDGLRHVDLVAPLLGANGITVQGINDRIAPGFLLA